MANAYVFNAAIYCEECAVETMTPRLATPDGLAPLARPKG